MRTPPELAQAARAFVLALTADLAERSAQDSLLTPFVRGLKQQPVDRLQRGPVPRLDHPGLQHLDSCLVSATGSLAGASRDAAKMMDWSQVFAGGGIEPGLTNGLFAAQAIGTYGCFQSQQLAVGLFLLAPGLHYPLHTHAASEIYYSVSGELRIQHGIDATPFTLSAGDYSVTPPHQLHSLKTGEAPVLLIYLWQGEIVCENWWWSREADGSWLRTAWLRESGRSWQPARSEKVTEAHREQANA